MQSLCNQSVMRKMSWSVGRVAGVMINAQFSNGSGSTKLDHHQVRLTGAFRVQRRCGRPMP
jgi:hypothetical protein